MLRIFAGTSSSGTGGQIVVSAPAQEPIVEMGLWNTAEIGFVQPPSMDPVGHSPRPLSAVADLAVDLGAPDLSTTFRRR